MGKVAAKTGLPQKSSESAKASKPSRTIVREYVAAEVIFAIVGPVGSGTTEVCQDLKELLKKKGFSVSLLKARNVIEDWAKHRGIAIPKSPKMEQTQALQDAGDLFREETGDNAAVALQFVKRIRDERARLKGESPSTGNPVDPDGSPRAFILDSLRNPAEASLLLISPHRLVQLQC